MAGGERQCRELPVRAGRRRAPGDGGLRRAHARAVRRRTQAGAVSLRVLPPDVRRNPTRTGLVEPAVVRRRCHAGLRMTSGMDGIDDIEAIKKVKARYFRTMDTKDWDGMRRVFTDDVVMDTTASGGSVITGADEFIDFLKQAIGPAVTVHQGHMPEIEITSPSTATGIWALEDWVQWEAGGIHGFGHYYETYEKTDGEWRIKSSTLTRLRLDVDGAQ